MKHVHFLGIGGSGGSAVAAIAQAQGFEISGCDKNPHNEFTQVFKSSQLSKGHSPNHLSNIDILALTPAIYSLDPHNPELISAQEQGIEVMTWQQFMGKYLERGHFVIAICGTHGKSTTTAMIGQVLEDAGLDPTVELGAVVSKWGKNYRIGKGKYFITEADEFNDNFLNTHPDISVVTSVEMDHPEYFKDITSYESSFRKFLLSTKQLVIANLSDQGVFHTLGSHPRGACINITDYSQKLIDFSLKIPGEYNRNNASAAYQVGLALEIDPDKIKQSLASFTGIGRRFELLGEFSNVKIYSDFGHHPTEIKVTLEAAREKFPDQRIIVIFQPHMFSRTFALLKDFVKVFQKLPVNQVYILDIFPSREIDTGLITSQQLVETINEANVKLVQPREKILELLKKEANSGDIIFFIGAGDIHELAKQLVTESK